MKQALAICLTAVLSFVAGILFVLANDEAKCFADPTAINRCVMDRDVSLYLDGHRASEAQRGYVFQLGEATKQ